MTLTLSILDLAPLASGQDAGAALAHSLDLAQHADAWGYRRIWFAEHHLTPGVTSAAPAVLAALAAERTSRIRVGSGAVLLAHTSPAVALEQFATIARMHPGRVDLGLGRAHTGPPPPTTPAVEPSAAQAAPGPVREQLPEQGREPQQDSLIDGVVVPAPPAFRFDAPGVRETLQDRRSLIGDRTNPASYAEELATVLRLLEGGVDLPGGRTVQSPIAAGADLEVWTLASSGGDSARAAGALGLPLVANYHVSPATVLETVAAYREAFRPGVLTAPYLIVSVDAVVAATSEQADRIAAGYAHFVLSIRDLRGAEPYRSPEEAERDPLTAEQVALVHDRLVSQVVGEPAAVARRLRALAALTGADELLVTTSAHEHADRLRSYELLATAWRADDPDGSGAAGRQEAGATLGGTSRP